jgi:16S rRNA G966 N2-methylase RsmD
MTEQMRKLFQGPVAESGPVECLGQTFPSDEARREHYLKLLAQKLKDPAFRKIEGFPIGTDEAILAMSDPPYYTACPNPFIEAFIRHYGKSYDSSADYANEPFATDVTEGKGDPLYGAHAYHTKVPPKAIARYLLHYTKSGDIVLDGFSGTGMTGLASQLCGDRAFVKNLGYRVDDSGYIHKQDQQDRKEAWQKFSTLGARMPILSDLSPLASSIASGYGELHDLSDFQAEAKAALADLEQEIGWVYERAEGHVKSGIWSDIFECPNCSQEIVFWNAAVINGEINKTFSCPSCNKLLGKAISKVDGSVKLDRSFEAKFDIYLNSIFRIPKLTLVEENITKGKAKLRAPRDAESTRQLIRRIEEIGPIASVPVRRFEPGRQTNKLINGSGIEYVHSMYTPRALFVYGRLWQIRLSCYRFTSLFRFCLTGINNYISRKQGYFGGGGGVSGTLFTPSVHLERNIFDVLRRKLKGLNRASRRTVSRGCISTQSSRSLCNIPGASIDYVFTDPPFGENFQYAELNSFIEAWLEVQTNTPDDCVMNYVHKKGLTFYLDKMRGAFEQYYRVLKPGRWITVEFSNTQASVWNAIQVGMQEAGFVVANVSALHKKQLAFNAINNKTSVKQDLIISAYKPNGGLEERFALAKGSEESVWDFVRTHLRHLPIVRFKGSDLDFVAERDPRIIFDRMVAWFVRHSAPVPLSSQEFQQGLAQHFELREGMIFLSDEVPVYDKKRAQVARSPQMELFVMDERSAIDWLTDLLKKRPSTYQEISPEFMTQLGAGWKKHESRPELLSLLRDNFIQYDGTGDVPSQIHSYLSSNYRDLRSLGKSSEVLAAKAAERWYVPDPNKAQDLEKKREKALLKEFATYQAFKGRRLKEFRLEVLRAGFKAAWTAKDYKTIISTAQRIPEAALQEDEKLLLWYDQALTRTEAGV